MDFKTYFDIFLETRKVEKQYVVDQLEKYKDDPNIFISFTMDLGGPKLGINPKSTYSTPIGIYAYPLSLMWDQIQSFHDIPFAKEQPNIFVFRLKKDAKLVIGSEYSEDDMYNDLGEIMSDEDYIRRIFSTWFDNVKNRTSDKLIDYTMDAIYETHGKDGEEVFIKHVKSIRGNGGTTIDVNQWIEKTYIDFIRNHYIKSSLNNIKEKVDNMISLIDPHYARTAAQKTWSVLRKISEENPVKWTKQYLKLGYSGVVDDTGEGFIHQNEPTQAVFFKLRDLEVLDLIKNKGTNNWWRNGHQLMRIWKSEEPLMRSRIQDIVHGLINIKEYPHDVDDAIRRFVEYTFLPLARKLNIVIDNDTLKDMAINIKQYTKAAVEFRQPPLQSGKDYDPTSILKILFDILKFRMDTYNTQSKDQI